MAKTEGGRVRFKLAVTVESQNSRSCVRKTCEREKLMSKCVKVDMEINENDVYQGLHCILSMNTPSFQLTPVVVFSLIIRAVGPYSKARFSNFLALSPTSLHQKF